MIKSYQATSIQDVYEALDCIASENRNRIMWFRGATRNDYNLLASGFHDPDFSGGVYGIDAAYRRQRMEEMKYMNFRARADHMLDTVSDGMMNWAGILQHYGGHTRMLEWSESMKTGLGMALRYFLEPDSHRSRIQKREEATPILWILDPVKLNEKVYFHLSDDKSRSILETILHESQLHQLGQIPKQIDALKKRLIEQRKFFPEWIQENVDVGQYRDMKGIVCLSAMDEMRKEAGTALHEKVINGAFSAYYYLLLRVYVDSVPVGIDNETFILPPVATLQLYNDSRMQTRRGTFTAFPNYYLSETMFEKRRKMGADHRAINFQPEISDCLYRIQLLLPGKIAGQLLEGGERISELYPNLDKVVDVLEAKKYYL